MLNLKQRYDNNRKNIITNPNSRSDVFHFDIYLV